MLSDWNMPKLDTSMSSSSRKKMNMLAKPPLKNRGLEAACQKTVSPAQFRSGRALPQEASALIDCNSPRRK
jgi:hypothetical protein